MPDHQPGTKNAPVAVLSPRAVHAAPADALRWALRQRFPILCGGAWCPRCAAYVKTWPPGADGRPRWGVLLRPVEPHRDRYL